MKHFKREEFNCKHCGKNEMRDDFLEMLDNAREIAGVPFKINSGYRCSEHNAAIGSTSVNHVSGRAADIAAVDGPTRGAILRGLYLAGFKRIGLHRDFIHADNTPQVASAWFY
ncbi:MAG TPA: D-Ala-D-Ala carboxypeptidase family metallohydrolase [Smithellaceae bacterium]|nr:D-Ala-D-Ala carboxypeptidase family metallohydrolase [Smithellaceae bacterium]